MVGHRHTASGDCPLIIEYDHIQGRTREIVQQILQSTERVEDFPLHLVLDELVQNIVEYAYRDTPDKDGPMRICITRADSEKVIMELIDSGRAFNPLEAPEPDTQATLSDRQIGGLGIFLSAQYANLQYTHPDNCNHLIISYPKA